MAAGAGTAIAVLPGAYYAAYAAGLLLVMSVLPFTAWIAAIVIPAWLGLDGAFSREAAPTGR